MEILSGGKDEALNQLRKIMKGKQSSFPPCSSLSLILADLMQENQVLRSLLRNLSAFIGDGAGGVLPKMGWDLNDFNNFVNRSETDTAWESYQRHKRDETHPGTSSSSQKRPSEDDANVSRAKRPRVPGEQNGDEERGDGYPLLVPMNPAVPPVPANGLYPPPPPSRSDSSLFNELMRGPTGSPMFVPPSSSTSAGQYSSATATSVSAGHSPYQSSYMPPMNVNVDPGLSGMSLASGPNVPLQAPRGTTTTPSQPPTEEAEEDPKREEAVKLILSVGHSLSDCLSQLTDWFLSQIPSRQL